MFDIPSLEGTWRYIHEDVFHKNDLLFFYIGQAVAVGIPLWSICGFFTYADLTGKPAWIQKYKVQQTNPIPVDGRRLLKAFRVGGMNLLCVNVPFNIVLYALLRHRGCGFSAEELPTLTRFLRDYIGFVIVEAIGFYYFHRLFHWGPLYRNVHKLHHEWTAPSAIVAIYAHPLEHLVANTLPFTMGPALMSAHFFTVLVWYSTGLFTTLVHHSGYHLPFLPSPQYHDYHHLKFSVNYGLLGLLDWLHGTDETFRKSVQCKRHRILLKFRPIHQIYPDVHQN